MEFASNALGKGDAALAGLTQTVGNNPTDLLKVSQFVAEQIQKGVTPLSLTGFTGRTATSQLAYVPIVPSLPSRNNALAVDGQLVWYNGQLYRYNAAAGTATSPNQPGAWQTIAATILEGTHAARPVASTLAVGTVYWETDRTVLYVIELVGGSNVWAYMAGVYDDILANRPSDLGVNDVGFQFAVSTYNSTLVYRWTGSTWAYYLGHYAAAMGSRPTLAAGDVGFQFIATDTNIEYQWNGTGWIYLFGEFCAAIGSRPTPSSTETGVLFQATDWDTRYRWNGTNWIYLSGVYSDVTANRPGSLTTHDAGFLFIDTTLIILERWTGSAWTTITVAPGSITLSQLANIPADTIIGNNTGSPATPIALTQAQATALLNLFTSSLQGLVPASGGGTSNFLRADGIFAAPAGSGVTSIGGLTGAITMAAVNSGTGGPVLTVGAAGSTITYTLTEPGAWTPYTPSVTNLSGSPTFDCAYQQIGKAIYIRISATAFPSVSAVAVTFTLPVTAKSINQTLAAIQIQGGSYANMSCAFTSTTVVSTEATSINSSQNSNFMFTGVYEAA